jgi:hypothetical protein
VPPGSSNTYPGRSSQKIESTRFNIIKLIINASIRKGIKRRREEW